LARVCLADRRNAKTARRFLSAALKRSRDWILRVINTGKNLTYGEAIAEAEAIGRALGRARASPRWVLQQPPRM
jgi:transposase-like protein